MHILAIEHKVGMFIYIINKKYIINLCSLYLQYSFQYVQSQKIIVAQF